MRGACDLKFIDYKFNNITNLGSSKVNKTVKPTMRGKKKKGKPKLSPSLSKGG